MKIRSILLLLAVCTLAAAAKPKSKPFQIEIEPGKTEYTVTPPVSGTFWVVTESRSSIPVDRERFADLRWDDGPPVHRRILGGGQSLRQETRQIALERVVFKQGVPRKLHFAVESKEVEVKRILFRAEVPTKVRPAAAEYKPPFDPPAAHPRVLVNPAFLKELKQNLTVGENKPAWEAVRETARKPFVFRIDPKQELRFQGPLVSALRQKAFYYLVTGDEKVGREAIDLARKYLTNVSFGNGQDICRKVGECIYSVALVYDWCYPLMTAEDKKILHDRMLYFCPEMEVGWPPFRQSAGSSGHGNEAQLSRDLLSMALAVWNEDPEPWKWLAWQMLESLQPAKTFVYQSERHDQGTMYSRARHGWDLFAALQFRRTFGYELLPPQAGKVAYMYYYMRLPDGRFFAEGDYTWSWAPGYEAMSDRMLLPNIALYRDPEIKQELIRGKRSGVLYGDDPSFFLLINDPKLKAEDLRPNMPLTRIYSSPLPGMYVRTGWNFSTSADDAVLSMQGAGYHFDGHQHMDMGSFQIYYRGNLVADLGQYRLFGVPYDRNLAKTSALHSLMRFQDPEQKKWHLHPRTYMNTGSEDIDREALRPTELPSGIQHTCRRVGTTPFAGCGPDRNRPVYDFMEADLAPMFRGRVNYYTRSFIFLNQSQAVRPGTLLILDRFETTAPRVLPIFQLTTIAKPEWKDGVLTVETRQYGKPGKLTVTPLVPAKVEAKLLTGKDAHTFAGKYIAPRNPSAPEANGTRTEFTGPGGVFLTALQIHDGLTPALPVRAAEKDGRYFVELEDRPGWLVGFGDPRKTTVDKFSFRVPRDKTRVLLIDLAPGNWRIRGGKTDVTLAAVKGEGSVFTVLERGEYEITPNSTETVSPMPDLRAVPPPPPARDQVLLDGKLLSGVKTVARQGQLLVPAAAFVKPEGTVLRIPGPNAATLRVGDKAIAVRGWDIPLPFPLDKDFHMPVMTLCSLLGMTAETDPENGTVKLNKLEEPSDILLVTATRQPKELFDMLVRKRGEWAVYGRRHKADIVFSDVRQLSGIEFNWPHGAKRKQFLRVDVSPDGKKFDTVFDGASDGKSNDQVVKFPRRSVRVIRLYMKGNSANNWNTAGPIRFLP